MDFTIISLGNVEFLSMVLNGVAMICGTGNFARLVAVGFVIGLLFSRLIFITPFCVFFVTSACLGRLVRLLSKMRTQGKYGLLTICRSVLVSPVLEFPVSVTV